MMVSAERAAPWSGRPASAAAQVIIAAAESSEEGPLWEAMKVAKKWDASAVAASPAALIAKQ